MRPLTQSLLGIISLLSVHAFGEGLKYENVPNFFDKLPGGQPQGGCHGGVAIDKAGDIYVTTDTPRGILVFSPDGKLVAALRRNQPVRLWRVSDLKELASLALEDPQESLAATFSADGRLLAVTYADHTIGLWDTTSGALRGVCTGHKQPAFAVAFSVDNQTLASAGADSTLRMWNVATQQELLVDRRLGAGLRELLFSPDGQLLVGGIVETPADGLRVYRAPIVPEGLLRSAKPAATANIN